MKEELDVNFSVCWLFFRLLNNLVSYSIILSPSTSQFASLFLTYSFLFGVHCNCIEKLCKEARWEISVTANSCLSVCLSVSLSAWQTPCWETRLVVALSCVLAMFWKGLSEWVFAKWTWLKCVLQPDNVLGNWLKCGFCKMDELVRVLMRLNCFFLELFGGVWQ